MRFLLCLLLLISTSALAQEYEAARDGEAAGDGNAAWDDADAWEEGAALLHPGSGSPQARRSRQALGPRHRAQAFLLPMDEAARNPTARVASALEAVLLRAPGYAVVDLAGALPAAVALNALIAGAAEEAGRGVASKGVAALLRQFSLERLLIGSVRTAPENRVSVQLALVDERRVIAARTLALVADGTDADPIELETEEAARKLVAADEERVREGAAASGSGSAAAAPVSARPVASAARPTSGGARLARRERVVTTPGAGEEAATDAKAAGPADTAGAAPSRANSGASSGATTGESSGAKTAPPSGAKFGAPSHANSAAEIAAPSEAKSAAPFAATEVPKRPRRLQDKTGTESWLDY